VGTFTTTFLALLIAVPVGLGAAVYISEFAKGKVKESLKVIIELLAAIPSIVWGFIGLMVIGPIIKDIFTAPIQPVWGNFTRVAVGISLSAVIVSLGCRWGWRDIKPSAQAAISWTAVALTLPAVYFGLAPLGVILEPFVSGSLSDFWGQVM